jgi:hypothetical protein
MNIKKEAAIAKTAYDRAVEDTKKQVGDSATKNEKISLLAEQYADKAHRDLPRRKMML